MLNKWKQIVNRAHISSLQRGHDTQSEGGQWWKRNFIYTNVYPGLDLMIKLIIHKRVTYRNENARVAALRWFNYFSDDIICFMNANRLLRSKSATLWANNAINERVMASIPAQFANIWFHCCKRSKQIGNLPYLSAILNMISNL